MGRLIYLEKKKHDDFKSFKFLADATELNEDRKAFNYIYADGKRIFSTDSRRLHIVKNELESGYYKVLKKQATKILLHKDDDIVEGITFPNYKSVIPKNYMEWNNTIYRSNNYNIVTSSMSIIKLLREIPDNKGLNINYLKDLMDGDWTVYFNDLLESFVFEDTSKKHTALIMPIRMDEK